MHRSRVPSRLLLGTLDAVSFFFFFSSRRRHTRCSRDWSSDVCSSDLRALADPQFGRDKSCADFTPPAAELGPHVAALGMRFYTGAMFPPEYRGRIFIAEHGSWNRSTPIGYRLTTVRLEGDRVVGYEPCATGWRWRPGARKRAA